MSRYYDGFPAETTGGSRGYRPGLIGRGGQMIMPSLPREDMPIVFLVNKYSEIPPLALGLEQSGQGRIITMDSLSDEGSIETLIMNWRTG